jgi:hypothetical protein
VGKNEDNFVAAIMELANRDKKGPVGIFEVAAIFIKHCEDNIKSVTFKGTKRVKLKEVKGG